MSDTSYFDKPKEICPACGEGFGKPYTHYMLHVKRGEMVYEDIEVITIKRVFRLPSVLLRDDAKGGTDG
jgi:hypothetical protein